MSTRGEHLLRADRGFATGGARLARIAAPAFSKVLDQLDRKLALGGMETTLPDGSCRRLGFHRRGPEAIVRLNSWMALLRLATSGSVGWYKSWTLGEWSSPDPVRIFELFSANAVALGDVGRAKGPFRLVNAIAHRLRDNAPRKARENIAAHYDLGNDFYAAWLDPTMTYSSARFASADDSLETAQLRKIHDLLDRLHLKAGDRLLEIGCGWGTLAIEAARLGAQVVGLTLSTEQKAWAEDKIAAAGLADRIEIRLQDYRDTDEQFDAVASVEMVEAVGQRWWGTYLGCIARNLKPRGRAALQYISIEHSIFDRYVRSADFIQTYVFPGGCLIDEQQFKDIAAEHQLIWSGRASFGRDYAETLKRWRHRYDEAVARGVLNGFGEPFHQLWRYYLMYCEGGFRGGAIDVAQVTLTPES
ncbi:cyclopropane-fatty-acyl-phospholipid synthase family protein [Sphingomonas limnosediminicola]|uniref:Cyclopropane-fatty-acyl-phospholipid synthase family protein n=1 Tax=Sphingomonas limnosediminicola TaxID=940133 RepID=A0ABP7L0T7_9SPHN